MKSFNSVGYYSVESEEDMPKTPHYAVMEFGSMYIPGDERSQSNPGHGYPAETVATRSYLVFMSKETWEAYISKLKLQKYGKTAFVALYTTPATITQTINVSVKV